MKTKTRIVIVDDHRQHIDRRPIGAEQDHVVELLVADHHIALNDIMDHRLAGLAGLEADDRLAAGRRFAGIAVAPAAVVAHLSAFGLGPGAHLLQFLGRHVNNRYPILRHQIKQLVAVYIEEFGRFALRNLVFAQELHG